MFICSRCLGLYSGLIIGFLASITFDSGNLFNKGELLIIGFIMCSPLAIDGITQLLKWRESKNWLRLITGILAGSFCGMGITYLIMKYGG